MGKQPKGLVPKVALRNNVNFKLTLKTVQNVPDFCMMICLFVPEYVLLPKTILNYSKIILDMLLYIQCNETYNDANTWDTSMKTVFTWFYVDIAEIKPFTICLWGHFNFKMLIRDSNLNRQQMFNLKESFLKACLAFRSCKHGIAYMQLQSH